MLLTQILATPLQVVGMEGVLGLILTMTILWPIASFFIPGNDHGHVEDISDTFYMVADNTYIMGMTIVFFISIIFLNWSGLTVT